MLVKIRPDTIKRNPDAGRTRTYIQRLPEVTFICERDVVPEGWEDQNIVAVSQWSLDRHGRCDISGYLINLHYFDHLSKIPGMVVNSRVEPIIFDHLPLPEWLYKYEDPLVPCDVCGKETLLHDIEWEDLGDGIEVSVCEHCGRASTFQIQYQKIEEALSLLENLK